MEYGDKEEKSRCVRRILSGVELDSIVMVDTGIEKDYKENLSTDSQQGWACSSFDNEVLFILLYMCLSICYIHCGTLLQYWYQLTNCKQCVYMYVIMFRTMGGNFVGWSTVCYRFMHVHTHAYILHMPGQFVYVYNNLVYIITLTFVLTHVCT